MAIIIYYYNIYDGEEEEEEEEDFWLRRRVRKEKRTSIAFNNLHMCLKPFYLIFDISRDVMARTTHLAVQYVNANPFECAKCNSYLYSFPWQRVKRRSIHNIII